MHRIVEFGVAPEQFVLSYLPPLAWHLTDDDELMVTLDEQRHAVDRRRN